MMVVVKFLCVCKSPCCAYRPTQALYMQRPLLSTAAGFFPPTVQGTFLLPPVWMYCNAVERKGPVVGVCMQWRERWLHDIYMIGREPAAAGLTVRTTYVHFCIVHIVKFKMRTWAQQICVVNTMRTLLTFDHLNDHCGNGVWQLRHWSRFTFCKAPHIILYKKHFSGFNHCSLCQWCSEIQA